MLRFIAVFIGDGVSNEAVGSLRRIEFEKSTVNGGEVVQSPETARKKCN